MDMQETVLEVDSLSVRLNNQLILQDLSFVIRRGETLAVVGATGSGKTTLIHALAGRIFHSGTVAFRGHDRRPHISVITRQHRFTNRSNISSFYYQQRFNSFDAEDAHTVEDELCRTGAGMSKIKSLLDDFGISHVLHSPLIQLSNGEHKRFQLLKALLEAAEWMLLDNPYIGLDVDARKSLDELLENLVLSGKKIILFTGPGDLPSCITHVAALEKGRCSPVMPKAVHQHDHHNSRTRVTDIPDPDTLRGIPAAYTHPDFSVAVRMNNVHVAYGERRILDGFNWEVRKGECWHVAGPNGSGKSTLLSLINGDNPQAFASEVWLFDRRKGSGESIWDIKRMIGHVSPELHHYFEASGDCFDIVASGLFDTIGLFRKLTELQRVIVQHWMDVMQVGRFAQRSFRTLSDGEQRRILLTRALVKDPPMLILDEPCQGLDEDATKRFNALVNAICQHLGKTLLYVSHYEADIPSCVTKRMQLSLTSPR
jgi:molybdate transport system ATP-binding protein